MYKIIEKNGYKCIYVNKKNAISSIRIIVNAGASHEEDKTKYGLAHFVEHMFFKGSENKTSKEIRDLMGLYGKSNAYTDFSKTVYYMKSLEEDVENSLNLLCEVLFQPKYEQEEIKKEANVIKEENQSVNDDPVTYFFDNLLSISFPVIGHSRGGTKETVDNINIDDLYSFLKSYYFKDRICFVLVTSLPEDKAEKIFEKAIDKWSTGYNSDSKKDIELTPIKGGIKKLNHASEQSIVCLNYQSLTRQEEYNFNFVNNVFLNGFGGGMHSILFDRVREKLGLCYSISAFDYYIGDNSRTLFFTMLQKENVDNAINEMKKCFKEVQDNGFDEELLLLAKKNCVFDVANSSQTSSNYAQCFLDSYFEVGLRDCDEIINKINSIENKDVIEYARFLNESPEEIIMMNV